MSSNSWTRLFTRRLLVHIAVILKQVPDLVEEVEVDPNGTDIDRDGIKWKLNEFDDHALEQAVLLR